MSKFLHNSFGLWVKKPPENALKFLVFFGASFFRCRSSIRFLHLFLSRVAQSPRLLRCLDAPNQRNSGCLNYRRGGYDHDHRSWTIPEGNLDVVMFRRKVSETLHAKITGGKTGPPCRSVQSTKLATGGPQNDGSWKKLVDSLKIIASVGIYVKFQGCFYGFDLLFLLVPQCHP